jgi:hypothetical protein
MQRIRVRALSAVICIFLVLGCAAPRGRPGDDIANQAGATQSDDQQASTFGGDTAPATYAAATDTAATATAATSTISDTSETYTTATDTSATAYTWEGPIPVPKTGTQPPVEQHPQPPPTTTESRGPE